MFLYVSLVQNASYERFRDMPRGIDEYKSNLTKMYVESLQFETKSLMSETPDIDSGRETEGAPSEFNVDIGGQYQKVKITMLSLLTVYFYTMSIKVLIITKYRKACLLCCEISF